MEKKLDGAEPVGTKEKWKRHSIFRVPHRFKAVHGNVFAPQTVALGPFHHHDAALRPTEEHKLRAVRRLLRRAGDRPLRELAAAVGDMAEELEDAYAGLGAEWRGGNRGRFLELMVADGCFLLEVMRRQFKDYDPDDPVFGEHAGKHIAAFVQRDMLMIENQLPLALLRRIVADERSINNLVAEFLCEDGWCATEVEQQGPVSSITVLVAFHDHDLAGSDWAVVRLVNRLSRDVAKIGDSDLCRVRREVEDYCNGDKWRVFVFKSWAKLKGTYLSSPWAFIALVVTIWLVGTDMTQTLYAVKT
ncbi:hypothetical protein C2845_PM18G08980 [Panicum miliaceum]|uniref:Uncharacterized protein n=1 Tax=Panicum miliaceum TaxID=4540 RepID=A0A3L6PHV3_PANMI|nr:hypothetical protein C2845_PM18G08980 [Panicum miliaceum]